MTRKKITADIAANWTEEELFTALQKNQESKSSDWERLALERNIIECELASRTLDDEEEDCSIERITRTYQDWGLFHPDQTDELTPAQRDELRDVAFELNKAFYLLVLNVPDHKNLPYTRVSAILEGFDAFGAADSEGFRCAAELLCEYYGAPQAYEQWRYPA